MAAIPFVFYAVLSSILLQANAQTNPPNVTCSDSVTSYCTSCRTQAICPTNGTTFTNSSCINSQVCKNDTGYAVCTDPTNVPGCKCNSTGSSITYQCDPYGEDRYIVCYKGAIQSGSTCTNGQVCIPATGKCGPRPTTTPSPTAAPSTTTSAPIICVEDDPIINKNSCTTFYFCTPGEYRNYQECEIGQIFSTKISDCVSYTATFNCPTPTGVFADPFNCSLVHTCTNNVDSISLCPPKQFFDEVVRGCTADSNCTTEECTPCRSITDVFPVNETACVRDYKQCNNVTNNATDNFALTVKSCPGTYLFDPIKKGCSKQICSVSISSWFSME